MLLTPRNFGAPRSIWEFRFLAGRRRSRTGDHRNAGGRGYGIADRRQQRHPLAGIEGGFLTGRPGHHDRPHPELDQPAGVFSCCRRVERIVVGKQGHQRHTDTGEQRLRHGHGLYRRFPDTGVGARVDV